MLFLIKILIFLPFSPFLIDFSKFCSLYASACVYTIYIGICVYIKMKRERSGFVAHLKEGSLKRGISHGAYILNRGTSKSV